MANSGQDPDLKVSSAQEVVLIGGAPASGKSSLAERFVQRGYERLNRDLHGGKTDDLLPKLAALIDQGRSVVLDNLYATASSRAGAIAAAKQRGIPVRSLEMETSLEDAQFNACMRMIERTGRLLHPEDHKDARYKSDPNLFPIVVMYKYRNEYEAPSLSEGFSAVERAPFARRYPEDWVNKAFIFDFDGTLRTTTGAEKYPTKPSEVRAMTERAGKLRELAASGALLLGASNQSGIAKRHLTAADAEACFAETLRQLGVSFEEVRYCPHRIPPLSCYCRKPGPGMGAELIAKYKLDPRQCVYVGDMTTDRTFAARCGFQFVDHDTFFG